jgi:hypothetical protein
MLLNKLASYKLNYIKAIVVTQILPNAHQVNSMIIPLAVVSLVWIIAKLAKTFLYVTNVLMDIALITILSSASLRHHLVDVYFY